MVLAVQPVFDCVEAAAPPRPLLALGPGGRPFTQAMAHELADVAADTGFSLLCGRYEGFDQRVHDHLVDGEISLWPSLRIALADMDLFNTIGP